MGLNFNLPQAEGLIDAELIQGDYVGNFHLSWSEFDIDSETQQLTVTTYGMLPYTVGDIANDPSILDIEPEIISQFVVNPVIIETSILDFAGLPHNVDLDPSYGDRLPTTPNLEVDYTTFGFPAVWQSYDGNNDSSSPNGWEGGVAQLQSGGSFDFTLTPDFGLGVVLKSFDLVDYINFAVGHTVEWSLIDVNENTTLFSDTVVLNADEKRTIETGMTEVVDGSLVLRLNHIAGDRTDLAIDNIAFSQSEVEIEVPRLVTGTPEDDEFDSAFPDEKLFFGDAQTLVTGGGNDYVDVSVEGRRNRINTGTGNDEVYGGISDRINTGVGNDFIAGGIRNRLNAGAGNDEVEAGTNNRIILGRGDDILLAGMGNGGNRITTGRGSDQVWLIDDINAIPANANFVSDFDPDFDVIGFANTGLTLADKGDSWDYQQLGNNVAISIFGQQIAQLFNTTVTDANFVFI